MSLFELTDFLAERQTGSRTRMVQQAVDFATRTFVPDEGEERVDPLKRLFDPAFTDVTWYHDGSKVGDLPGQLHAKQLEALNHRAKHRWLLWGNQVGKMLGAREPVLTPDGWRAIGDLRVGDAVIAGDGTPTVVTGVYPQGIQQLYRVTFDDGASVLAGDEHLWKVLTPEARFRRPSEKRGDGYERVAAGYEQWSVLSTQQIRERWGNQPKPRRRCAIPVAPPARLERRGIKIDPYVLGVLLGDGCLTGKGVTFTTADQEILEAMDAALPPECRIVHSNRYDYRINGVRPLRDALRYYELMGCGSNTKFVPDDYMANAPDVRLAVLQGLLDTDGSVAARGAVEYTTVSPRLASNVVELVRSLGGKAKWSERQTFFTYKGGKKAGQLSYRIHIRLPGTQLFRLKRKQNRCFDATSTCDERVLYSIEPARLGEAVCISVAHADRTYITRDYIVTHNTSVGAIDVCLRALGRHPLQLAGLRPKPPYTGWASALTWELWEKILLPELLSWLPPWRVIDAPPPFKQSTRRDIIVLADNGTESRITGKAAQQGPAAYQSARVNQVWLDEEHPEEVWDEMQPRLLRWGGDTLATMTPLLGLTYVYSRVYEPVKTGLIHPDRHWYSHAGIRDNPSITPEARAELLEELKHNPAQLAARDTGQFVRPMGAVWPFDPETMFFDLTDEMRAEWKLRKAVWWGSVDLGKWRFTFPLVVIDHDGVYRLVDEYFSQNEGADVRAKGIHDMLKLWDVPDSIVIPADCADPGGIDTINTELERIVSPYRLHAIDGALKSKTTGISRVENLMNRGAFLVRRGIAQDRVWKLGMNASKPGKPVMGSRWVWEVSNWQYPKTLDGKIQKDEPDDATADGADFMDATRYLVMEAYGPDVPVVKAKAPTVAQRIQAEIAAMRARDDDGDQPKPGNKYGHVMRQ